MADERTFLEKSNSMAEKMTGKPASVDDMVTEFSKYGLERRANALDAIDADLSSDEPLTMSDMRKQVKILQQRRALGAAHEALRRAGR